MNGFISKTTPMRFNSIYEVKYSNHDFIVDGNWEKEEWSKSQIITVSNFLGKEPKVKPVVNAKMLYTNAFIYVIFKVKEPYVKCITTEINGNVWEDNCVEFFFAPDSNFTERYFNLEVNCGGTPLMHYNFIPRKDYVILNPVDIKTIEIAHSLPSFIPDEIIDVVTWTIEYRIPLSLFKGYSNISKPSKGIVWRGNFYKIAEGNSNPHYVSWSRINVSQPDFHLPQYFGKIIFQ